MSDTIEGVIADLEAIDAQQQGDMAAMTVALARSRAALAECEAGKPVDPPVIPPVLPPPTGETPWTHAYAAMDVEEAKDAARLRVTPILRGAPTKTYAGYDVVFPTLADLGDNGTLRDQKWLGRWGKIIGCAKQYWTDAVGERYLVPRTTNLRLDNLSFAPYPESKGGAGGFKWAVRMGNIPQATLTRLSMIGEVRNGRVSPKEHGVYLDVSGDVTMADCLWDGIGGHGAYFTSRVEPFQQYGRQSLPFTEDPTWICDNVIQIDNEQDASRGAFDFTFYDPGSHAFPGDVVLIDCVAIQAWGYQRKQGTNERHPITPYREGEVRACGTVMVTNYQQAAMAKPGSWPTNKVTILRSVLWTVQARHNLASMRGAKEYEFKDSLFKMEQGANPTIDIGAKESGGIRMAGPRKVVVENCRAEGVTLRLYTDIGESTTYTLDTVGRRWTWIDGVVTVEDLA